MSRSRILSLCLLVAAACATPPPPAPPPAESGRVATALREIEVKILRGEGQLVRDAWLAQVNANPNDRVVRFLAAISHPDPEQAWKENKHDAEKHPENHWAQLGMGLVYLRWRTWDKAEASIEKAISLAPNEPLLRVEKGEVLRQTERFDEAKALFQKALAEDPTLAEAHAGLGLTALAQGDKPGARKALEAALAASPLLPRAAQALAALCDEAGDVACAAKWWGAYVEMSPQDRTARLSLARARESAGDAKGAADAIEGGGPVEKAELETVRAAARLYQKLGDAAKERKALERLDRLNPRDVEVLRRVAVLAGQQGDAAAAEQAFLSILAYAPEDGEANLHVARASSKAGKLPQAIAGYRKAVGAGVDAAKAELAEMEKAVHVLSPSIDGTKGLQVVAQKVLSAVTKLAAERRKENPKLAGTIVAKVSVGKDGKASEVRILEDGTGDRYLAACVAVNLQDAGYPARAETFKLEFPVK